MFHHVKELQFDARVSEPDPRFASILLEQFGGANGELKAAMQYFCQAFAARQPYPDKYDMLMDIGTEEFSHLEIVGATITMLLDGVNGDLKDIAESDDITQRTQSKQAKESYIHEAMVNPQFFALTGGGPSPSDSQGNPWSGSYVTANGDLTVDLRSNIAAESRAKIVYEYLMQFTDDPHVKETLKFLMTREISHSQMFSAALETIQPNFPVGVVQGDPRYTHKYFNMSDGAGARGPWNEGQGPWEDGEEWNYIEEPLQHVRNSKGETQADAGGAKKSVEEADAMSKQLSQKRSEEIRSAMPKGENHWSDYSQKTTDGSRPRA